MITRKQTAKYVLRSMDDCTVYRSNGVVQYFWQYPYYRDEKLTLDEAIIEKLVKAGYLIWTGDGKTSQYLHWTDRGYTIVHYYRPISQRQFPVYPNYRNWLNNANRFQQYVKMVG